MNWHRLKFPERNEKSGGISRQAGRDFSSPRKISFQSPLSVSLSMSGSKLKLSTWLSFAPTQKV